MEAKFIVDGVATDAFDLKSGKHVVNHLLVLRDISPAGKRLESTLQYLMTDEETIRWADGKLVDKTVNVTINALGATFKGLPRILKGSVVEVNGDVRK